MGGLGGKEKTNKEGVKAEKKKLKSRKSSKS